MSANIFSIFAEILVGMSSENSNTSGNSSASGQQTTQPAAPKPERVTTPIEIVMEVRNGNNDAVRIKGKQ